MVALTSKPFWSYFLSVYRYSIDNINSFKQQEQENAHGLNINVNEINDLGLKQIGDGEYVLMIIQSLRKPRVQLDNPDSPRE